MKTSELALTPAEEQDIINGVRADLVANMIEKHADALNLVSAAQAAGIMNITPRTLAELPIPKIDLNGRGSVIRYDLDDIKSYKENQKIKA